MSALQFLQQENARLQEENKLLGLEKANIQRQLTAILELYRAMPFLDSAENKCELLDKLLSRVIQLVGANDGSISSFDPATGDLVFEIVHGDLEHQLRGYHFKGDAGIAGWVVSHKEPVIVNNPRQDWRFSFEVDEEFNFFTRSIVCAPIMAQDKLVGIIQLLNKQTGEFTDTDVVILEMLSQIAIKALAQK